MRAIPQWFKRELKNIDPRLEIEYDSYYNYFVIYITVGVYSYMGGRRRHFKDRITKACFTHLNDKAMADLRYRHWLAQKYNARGDRDALMKMWKAEEREAKQKIKNHSVDMMVEGLKKMQEIDTKQTYDMGGTA